MFYQRPPGSGQDLTHVRKLPQIKWQSPNNFEYRVIKSHPGQNMANNVPYDSNWGRSSAMPWTTHGWPEEPITAVEDEEMPSNPFGLRVGVDPNSRTSYDPKTIQCYTNESRKVF